MMARTTTRATRAGAPAPDMSQNLLLSEELLRQVESNPELLLDDAFGASLLARAAMVCGGAERAAIYALRQMLVAARENEKLKDKIRQFIKTIEEQKPLLGWVLSNEFAVNGNGSGASRRFVYAMPLGDSAGVAQCFEIAALGAADEGGASASTQTAPPPYCGLIDPANRLFFGAASKLPFPPLRTEICQAEASRCGGEGQLGEIEVSDGATDRRFTVFASSGLVADVKKRIEEEGETVYVTVASGVATGIHKTEGASHADYVEYPALDGPTFDTLIFSRKLRGEWYRDIRDIALGRPVRVVLIGPTGVGKTTSVERAGRSAWILTKQTNNEKRGYALIRISRSRLGSPYINETERNLFRAMRQAKALARKGWLVVVLWDEADGLLGEMIGAEHTHDRSERLAAQELLSEDIPNVAIYLTMNPRRNSWLPAAIERRFIRRVYPRATRGQLASVAEHYIGNRPQVLGRLALTGREFGGALADNLFADQRIVATAHMHSGTQVPVRVRDLQNCSPGKIESLIQRFCTEVEDGAARSLDPLWGMVDREFQAPHLNASNLYDLSFLKPPHDDAVRTVEIAG